MTNPSPSPPPSGPSNQEREQNTTATPTPRRRRQPWAIAIGVTTVTLGVVGYAGVRFLIEQKLPDIVAGQLGKIINREVRVGDVTSFSLGGITFGSSSIPPTSTDPDFVTIEAIEVSFNLLPLLTERQLPVAIKLVEPNLYVQQDRTGQWLDLDLELEEEQERPFDLYVDLYLEDGEVVGLPYDEDVPITTYLNGSGTFVQVGDEKEISYDVEAAIRGGNLSVKGETQLETGKTVAQANIQNLALPPLVSLLPPDVPVAFNSGELDANLKVQVPAIEAWKASLVQGTANLQNISADIDQLVEPITANARLRFNGTEAIVESARGSLGKTVTDIAVDGAVSLQKGYNLTVDVKPFEVARLVRNIREVSLPVDVGGRLQLDLQIGGAILDPRVTGTVGNVGRVRLDEVAFDRVNTNFTVALSQFTLNRLQAIPTAGGQITARGFLLTQIREALDEGREIDFTKMPLGLSFSAQLPVEEVAAPYYQFPAAVDIGTATATGRIQGTVDTPRGLVQWQIPGASTPTIGDVSGAGEVLLTGNNIFLRDTQLQTGGGGDIALAGSGNLENKRWQAALRATDVRLDPFLSQLQSEQIQLPDRVLLQTANARVAGRLDQLSLEKLQGVADLALAVGEGTASVRSQLTGGRLIASATASNLAISQLLPQLSQPVTLTTGEVALTSPVDQLLTLGSDPELSRLDAAFDARLAVSGGAVNAAGRIDNGRVVANATAANVPVNAFVSQLSEPVTLTTAQVNLTGALEEVLSVGSDPNLNSFDAALRARLAVAGGSVNAQGLVENGNLAATANATNIPVDRFLPQISEPISLVNSQVNLSGPLEQILTLRENPDLSRWEAAARAQLAVANGTVVAAALLEDNQWQAEAIASEIDTSQFREQLTFVDNVEALNLPALNARIDLSGELNSLIQQDLATTIQANTVAVQLGEQFLAATGSLLVTDLVSNPDIARLDLNLQARSNLGTLPINPILNQLTANRPYAPQELNVAGQADFTGRLQGENLLSAPLAPGSVELTGNLRLLDFSLNQLAFDPVLAGPVTIAPGQELALNLRGEEDVIAASVEPCTRGEQCLAPYLPASFEFRATQPGTQEPIIATGRRIGDRLVANVEQFPLGILNLAPAAQFGIPGQVEGALSANLDVNLFTLASSGNVQVLDPALGNIEGEEITASFDYRDNIVQLASASLEFGESDYDLSGRLNLNTQEIVARADADGNVQDILTVLNISSIESATRFFQPPDYATAAQIPTQAVGQPDEGLAYQLNILYRIEQMLRRLADERLAPGVPTQLDIQGPYSAEVLVAGTLQSPELNFELAGNNWQWQTQPAVPNLVEPLGFVIEDPQVVPISQVRVAGSYDEGTIILEPLWVRSGEATIAFSGNLSTQQESDGSFLVQNLPVDFIRNFVNIPLDVAGEINAQGEVEGTLPLPQVQGEIAFSEAAINGQALALDPIEAEFLYADTRLQVETTAPESIQVQASVPVPTQPGANNEQFTVDVALGTEAIALLGPLSEGRIEWVSGEGSANLEARGNLNLGGEQPVSNLAATGQVVLQDATLGIQSLPGEQITVNGQIAIDDQVLQVQQLQGTYAASQIQVTGALPLFAPIQYNAETAPLTAIIDQGEIELEDLYVGRVDAQVVVTNTALAPEIGGSVRVYDGQAFVPSRNQDQPEDSAAEALAETVAAERAEAAPATNQEAGGFAFNPQLQDFEVIVGEDFKLEQSPFYEFNLIGNLTLNGPATELRNIRPEGTIQLQRGDITFFDTQFFLDRRRANVVVFEPEQGLFNPTLDLQFSTLITEPNTTLTARDTQENENEIRDDLFQGSRSDTIRVALTIDGQASQILPSLARDASAVCQGVTQPFPIPSNDNYSQAQLNQLENCIQLAAFQNDASDLVLLNSPAVELSSSPPRDDGQIVALLAGQFIDLAEQLQNSNEEELLQFGVTQFIVEPLLRDVTYSAESAVSNAGRQIGLEDLRVFPELEGVYRIGQDSYVTLSYDYFVNEVRVEYETRFE